MSEHADCYGPNYTDQNWTRPMPDTQEHSPEPWTVYRNSIGILGIGQVGAHLDRTKCSIVHAKLGGYLEMSDADACRIVACVNACKGIPTSVLEAGFTDDTLIELLRERGYEVHDPHE